MYAILICMWLKFMVHVLNLPYMDPPWVVVPAVSAKMVSKMKIPESKAQRIPTNQTCYGYDN